MLHCERERERVLKALSKSNEMGKCSNMRGKIHFRSTHTEMDSLFIRHNGLFAFE